MAEFKTASIRATSRSSIKIGESYFTFESTIEKICPDNYTENEYNEAKAALWDEVNGEVDNQVIELQEYLKNKK